MFTNVIKILDNLGIEHEHVVDHEIDEGEPFEFISIKCGNSALQLQAERYSNDVYYYSIEVRDYFTVEQLLAPVSEKCFCDVVGYIIEDYFAQMDGRT